jgi:glutathione peroxidase-family protein
MSAGYPSTIYNMTHTDIDGNIIDFNDYRGKVVVVMNSATA